MDISTNVTVTEMKDASDNVTLELIPAKKRRGRPSTGTAMTPAERMRKSRRNQLEKLGVEGQGVAAMTFTGLYDHLRWAVSHFQVLVVEDVAAELISRTRRAKDHFLKDADLRRSQVEPSHQVEPSQVESYSHQVEPSQVESYSDFPSDVLYTNARGAVSVVRLVRYVGTTHAIVSCARWTSRVPLSRITFPKL